MNKEIKYSNIYKHISGLYKQGMFIEMEKKLPDVWKKIRGYENQIDTSWETASEGEFLVMCKELRKVLMEGCIKVNKQF